MAYAYLLDYDFNSTVPLLPIANQKLPLNSLFFQVVMDAVNKPHNIIYKGLTDLVTE